MNSNTHFDTNDNTDFDNCVTALDKRISVWNNSIRMNSGKLGLSVVRIFVFHRNISYMIRHGGGSAQVSFING